LIFTQMSKMLDVLEKFLSYHSITYSRLDGSTKPESRIQIMEQFNRDPRIFCMILSTRSGGVGVNLTGADVVIFYDSDWNPTIDAQAQDRAHRIGQTRDVNIYRFIAKNTIEENILKKANQKRHLGNLAIEDGNFNIDGLKEEQLRTLVEGKHSHLLASVEDEADASAAKGLIEEVGNDEEEFEESDESDTEGLRNLLSPIENYAVSLMEAEIGERIKEEEKNEEIRIERLKAKKEEKKEIREIADHKNSQNLIKEIVSEKRLSTRIDKQVKQKKRLSRRLQDKENLEEEEIEVRPKRSSRNRISKVEKHSSQNPSMPEISVEEYNQSIIYIGENIPIIESDW